MSARTLVVGDGPLLELASAWAAAGIIGDSFWANTAACTPERLTATGVRCVHLPGGASVELELVSTLAEEAPDAGLRVVWTRRDAAGVGAEADLAGMAALDDLLLPRAASVERIDLVAPQPDDLPRFPAAHANWETIVIGREDASAPGGTTSVPGDVTGQLLHTACVVGGVLGGAADAPPRRSASGAQHTRGANAFSRLVTGRARLTAAMAVYLAEELPGRSALDVHPRGHTDEGADVILSDTHDLVRRPLADGITFLQPPTQRFARDEIITLGGFLQRLKAFVDYLFHRSTALSGRDLVDNEIAEVLEREDMGLELVRHEPGVVDIVNYFDEDAALVAYLRQLWRDEVARSEEGRPDPAVWQDLLDTATGLVDGGPLPAGLPTTTRADRRIAVPLDAVQGGGELGANPARSTAGVAHEPLADDTAAATNGLVESLVLGASTALAGTASVASAVTGRIAERVSELDADLRAAQLAQLSAERATGALSWLETLRAEVAADLVASRLEAERSFALATAELDQITPLRGARFWFWVTAGVGGAVATQAANYLWGQDLSDWLLVNAGLAVSPVALTVVAGVASVVMVVLPFLSYYFAYLTYRSRGVRQLQARGMLFRRAVLAHREHLRLRVADRALARWSTVLRALYPASSAPLPGAPACDPPGAPLALQTAELTPPPKRVAGWLADAAAPAGWRGYALRRLADLDAGDRVTGDPLTRVCEDDGRPAGPLDTLAEEAGERWVTWLTAHREAVTRALHDRALAEATDVRRPNGPIEPLADFLGDIDGLITPAASYGRPVASERVAALESRLDQTSATMNPDVFVVSSRLYHRVLELDDVETDVLDSPPPEPGPPA